MNPPVPSDDLPWHARLNVLNVTVLLFVIAFAFSLPHIEGSGRNLDYWANLSRFLAKFYPPDFSVWPQTLHGLLETLQIAIVATALSIILSLPLAAAASRNLAPTVVVAVARMFLNFTRTVPSLIWALFAVSIVGANALAGVIALVFYSLGYLGKFYSDVLESADSEVAQGLRAMGAGSFQAFQYGLWPNAKPLIWSHSLWMLEYNIRNASIIGLVGAGGVGLQLHAYAEYGWWDRFATVLLAILAVVTLLDFLGEWIRKKVTKKIHKPLTAA